MPLPPIFVKYVQVVVLSCLLLNTMTTYTMLLSYSVMWYWMMVSELFFFHPNLKHSTLISVLFWFCNLILQASQVQILI